MENKRKVLLRFDDICPTMNWKQWNRAKATLDKRGATALLGVIPDNQDPALKIDSPREDFWLYIKELQCQGFCIAMHGYQHVFDVQACGIATPKKHSEFAGHPYAEQYRRLKEGKRILNEHGIETDVFFAPAHSYDYNTLKALHNLGFKYISDGRSFKPYQRYGITCLPERTGGIPQMKEDGYYTIVLHAHEWAKEAKKYVWNSFRELMDDDKNDFVTFNDYKNQPCGNAWIQRLYEHTYTILAAAKHIFIKIL